MTPPTPAVQRELPHYGSLLSIVWCDSTNSPQPSVCIAGVERHETMSKIPRSSDLYEHTGESITSKQGTVKHMGWNGWDKPLKRRYNDQIKKILVHKKCPIKYFYGVHILLCLDISTVTFVWMDISLILFSYFYVCPSIPIWSLHTCASLLAMFIPPPPLDLS